jgi:hypothetical protein
VKIAGELDHVLARRGALGKGRWIGDAAKYGRYLGADEIAFVERLGDDGEAGPLRRHIDGEAVLRAHLSGEIVAIARPPFVFAVPARSREHWNGADECAFLAAREAAASTRREMKLMKQISCPQKSESRNISGTISDVQKYFWKTEFNGRLQAAIHCYDYDFGKINPRRRKKYAGNRRRLSPPVALSRSRSPWRNPSVPDISPSAPRRPCPCP